MLNPGIIVSVQGYSLATTQEIAKECIAAGAIAIRTDRPIQVEVPVIGLEKIGKKGKTPYITPTLESVKRISKWSEYVAVDYRVHNENLKEISDYTKRNNIKIVADICELSDYVHIKYCGYHYTYIATTLAVLRKRYYFYPAFELLGLLKQHGEKNVIAEGNFINREQVKKAYQYYPNICIGGAITGAYKNTRKFTTVGK